MIIRRIGCTSASIPFRTPFVTAHGALSARDIWIVQLWTNDGAVGLGEASAVPGFGGSHVEVGAALQMLGRQIVGRDPAEAAEIVHDDEAAALAVTAHFGLDTAVQNLLAQAADLPLAARLSAGHAKFVAVNATVGAASTQAAVGVATSALAAGFTCVKLKVGISGSEEAEVARIAAVRGAIGPSMALRLDANGAWTAAQAIRILNAVEALNLEYAEQPVAARDIAGLARVRATVRTPIAADESAGSVEQVRRLIAACAADVIVIKPMLLGPLSEAVKIAALARDAGLGVSVTSTLDSGIGIAAALQIAAAIKSPLACGLATASLLTGDLLKQPLPIEGGAMALPCRAGLGVDLDPARLALVTRDSWELLP